MHAQAKDDGYRGIWSYRGSLLTEDEYVYLHYSGGFATAFAKHIPMACYAKAVDKTFFCYAGTFKDKHEIRIMASYYDHVSGTVPRPTILVDKGTDDAHDNPAMALDAEGYVWVFPSAHGTARPAYIFRSREPYSVEAFELVRETNFSYPQPWYVPGEGLLFLHTRYLGGRFLHWMTSRDGIAWSEPKLLAKIVHGQYQISWAQGGKVGTAFNCHPEPHGCESRTNLYYLETEDFGESWRSAQGEAVDLPLETIENGALVHDYQAEGLLVYMKDMDYDAEGNPVILYVTSTGVEVGPMRGPRKWTTARWTGSEWEIFSSIVSDNNYDTGCLHIEADGPWRIIGPTEVGPQPYNTGGEVAVWTSGDRGRSWERERVVTVDSPYNHTYVRKPVDAHPDFYAFWADGHTREVSESRLYFCDRGGERVVRLPGRMVGEVQAPEAVKAGN